MDIDRNNPLLDSSWVRQVGEALYTYCLNVGPRTDNADANHKQLLDAQKEANKIHREGWRLTSDAILKGFGLIADAIRQQGR